MEELTKQYLNNLKKIGINPKITEEGLTTLLKGNGEAKLGNVYKLKSKNSEEIYIGSTCKKLSERLREHKNNPTKTSKKIIDSGDVKIELLEIVPTVHEFKHELFKKETEWQSRIQCVNMKKPLVEDKYVVYNSEKYKEKKKSEEERKDQQKKASKKYREKQKDLKIEELSQSKQDKLRERAEKRREYCRECAKNNRESKRKPEQKRVRRGLSEEEKRQKRLEYEHSEKRREYCKIWMKNKRARDKQITATKYAFTEVLKELKERGCIHKQS
jgi:hypothetical protein